MKNHIKSNQKKIDRYNLGLKIAQGLNGGRNTAPQNSGVIMLIATLSEPIYDHRGYCRKNSAYAYTVSVRGKENVLQAIERGAIEFGFKFMKVVEIDENIHPVKKELLRQKVRASKWEWISVSSKKEAFEIITHNEKLLQPF